MNKIKIIILCLSVACIILMAFAFLKIRSKEEFQQKIVLAKETRKALEHLMVDLSKAHKNSMLDLPSDGQWHHRIAFDQGQQGILEYINRAGNLFRLNRGESLLIAEDIEDLRIRHQQDTPDILEVQIEAKKNVSLISNFKIRIQE